MAEESITCPKAPNEEIMRMLIRAESFLNHAKEHSISNTEFDVMIAIHNLDNALEYILRILIKHFDVENYIGKTIETCEIDILIGELKKFFADNDLPALPLVQEVKLIRKQRNMVQHAMTNPAVDLKIYIGYGHKFLERVLDRYFGITIADLHFSTLIVDNTIKIKVKAAEEKISEGNYLEAIIQLRDAFDYAVFDNPLFHSERIWNPPAIVEAQRTFSEIPHFLSNIYDLLSMSILDVDMPRYNRYREYIEYIPSEYCKDGGGHRVKQNPWTKEDSEFCYLFVCDTILHWQSFIRNNIDNPLPSDRIYEHEETFEDIRIDEYHASKGCLYINQGGTSRLFYVDSKEKVQRIKTSFESGYFRTYHKTTIDGNVSFEQKGIAHVLGFEYKLLINCPETWQMFVHYEDVPFTNIDLIKEEQVDLDSFGNGETNDVIGLIADSLPISTLSEAKSIEKKINEKGIKTSEFFSSKWIARLCEDHTNE